MRIGGNAAGRGCGTAPSERPHRPRLRKAGRRVRTIRTIPPSASARAIPVRGRSAAAPRSSNPAARRAAGAAGRSKAVRALPRRRASGSASARQLRDAPIPPPADPDRRSRRGRQRARAGSAPMARQQQRRNRVARDTSHTPGPALTPQMLIIHGEAGALARLWSVTPSVGIVVARTPDPVRGTRQSRACINRFGWLLPLSPGRKDRWVDARLSGSSDGGSGNTRFHAPIQLKYCKI